MMLRFARPMAVTMRGRQQMLAKHALGSGESLFAEGVEPRMGHTLGTPLHD